MLWIVAVNEIGFDTDASDFCLCIPETLTELIAELVADLGDPTRCYVWRGQTNFLFPPFPSLYRRLIKNGYKESEITEELVCKYETDLFYEAERLGHLDEIGGNRLDFMVQLQHMGGATRLLDVTRDPFVALWFAAKSNSECVGVVYRYAIDFDCHIRPEEIESWDEIVRPNQTRKPILFTPRRINERIKAQSAAFLTSVLYEPLSEGSVFSHATRYTDVKPIAIKFELKRDIMDYLWRSRGIRDIDLFPDFEGYAQYNSTSMPFPRKQNVLLFKREQQ